MLFPRIAFWIGTFEEIRRFVILQRMELTNQNGSSDLIFKPFKIMKNLIFGLIATLFFAIPTQAQNKETLTEKAIVQSITLISKTNSDKVAYQFNSLAEFDEGLEIILKDGALVNTETQRNAGKCEVSLEVSVTMSVGVASVTVTASATVGCAEVAATVTRLRKMLIASITG